MHDTADFKDLYTAYRGAWRRFAAAVELRQSDEAIEQAQVLYRQARNRLADYMISNRSRVETFNCFRASVGAERSASLPTA